MEQVLEILKHVVAVLGILAPAAKFLLGSGSIRPKELEERNQKIRAFFEGGGTMQHPFLLEAAFGAALGHLRLTAQEIPILMQQKEPTTFVERYLQVRGYLQPSPCGLSFELKSVASSRFASFVVRAVFFLFYLAFASGAMWLVFEGIPSLVGSGAWLNLLGAIAVLPFFGGAALFFIFEARRITWARQLFRKQNAI